MFLPYHKDTSRSLFLRDICMKPQFQSKPWSAPPPHSPFEGTTACSITAELNSVALDLQCIDGKCPRAAGASDQPYKYYFICRLTVHRGLGNLTESRLFFPHHKKEAHKCWRLFFFLISITQTKPESSSLGRNYKNIITPVLLLGAGRTTHQLKWSGQMWRLWSGFQRLFATCRWLTWHQGSVYALPESKTNRRKPQKVVCSAQRGAATQHGPVRSPWSPSWL